MYATDFGMYLDVNLSNYGICTVQCFVYESTEKELLFKIIDYYRTVRNIRNFDNGRLNYKKYAII